jgi:hypothetical protein
MIAFLVRMERAIALHDQAIAFCASHSTSLGDRLIFKTVATRKAMATPAAGIAPANILHHDLPNL